MTRGNIVRGAIATAIALVAIAFGFRGIHREVPAVAPLASASSSSSPVSSPSSAPASRPEARPAAGPPTAADSQGFLYGRVTTLDGAVYEGRLRWGGSEEAFWSDFFNGAKHENPWLAKVPADRRPMERHPLSIFGFEILQRERPSDVVRPFMAPFGELARIEAHDDKVRVTLKSGSDFELERFDASDFDDGVRVWDGKRGVVDLDSLRIRSIELLPTPLLDASSDLPLRLHGTVRTRQGNFSGFVAWNREKSVGSDELRGRRAAGELRLRLDAVRSLARAAAQGSRVTLLDGREIALTGSADVGDGNRGIYVDDPRYGRVLVSWEAFERVDFSPAGEHGSGPAYGDFPAGGPIVGSVTTRDGRRLAGRIVYDLDESATTETLDAPSQGVDYSIPFGSIAAIAAGASGTLPGGDEAGVQHFLVILHDGTELTLEPAGDLGEGNAGLLLFVAGSERPEYVTWGEVERLDLDRPPTVAPPLGGL